jgi:O-antigen/teichoic acid export membrane protein
MLKIFKNAAVNSLIYSFGNLSTKFVGLVLIPIYTKHLTVADYGILGLLEVTSYALFVLFGYQLYYAFFRWYWDKEYKDRQKSLFFTMMAFLAVSSTIVCFALCPASAHFSTMLFGKIDYSYLISLMIISSAFQIVSYNPSVLMRLQEKAFIYMISSTVRLIIGLVLTIILVVYFDRGVEGIFEAQIIGSFVYMLLITPYMLENIEFKFDAKLLFEMLKFSSPTIISGISAIIISLSDRYFLNYDSGLDATGIYAFGYKIANSVNVLVVASISSAITPLVYKMIDDKNNERFYSKIMTYSVYIISFCSLFFTVYCKEIVKTLSSTPGYWLSFTIIPIICLAIIFSHMRDTVMNGLNIVKKTKVIAFVLIISSLVNIAANYFLIPPFNYYGAANAFLLTHFLTYLLMLYFAQKYYPIGFETKKIVQILAVFTLITVLAFLCNDLNIVIRLLMKALLIGTFPFILYFLNFYEEIELDRLLGLWDKWKNPKYWIKNVRQYNF